MSDFLPEDVRRGLEQARKRAAHRSHRLRVGQGPEAVPIIDFGDRAFSLQKDRAPNLRGLVDIYDGTRHLYQALIVTAAEDGDSMVYEFKRVTPARDQAPVDYQADPDAPIALIGKG